MRNTNVIENRFRHSKKPVERHEKSEMFSKANKLESDVRFKAKSALFISEEHDYRRISQTIL